MQKQPTLNNYLKNNNMKKNKQKLAENTLRMYIRNEIRRIMEADDDSEDTQEEPTEKPQAKPEPKAEPEEEGMPRDFEKATGSYIARLKSSTESVDHDSLIEMVSTIIDSFVDSNEHKLSVLRAIKTKIVR